MMRPLVVGFVALAGFAVLTSTGCGGGATAKSAATAPASVTGDKAGTAGSASGASGANGAAGATSHTLRRSAVRGVVQGGLGLFLQKVALDDEPVLKNGRFQGFRITALHDPAFWSGVDVHAGDVVMRVNGMPIEHPEEALEAFNALESATELRVFYERNGEPRELTYPIVDDEPQAQKRTDASAP